MNRISIKNPLSSAKNALSLGRIQRACIVEERKEGLGGTHWEYAGKLATWWTRSIGQKIGGDTEDLTTTTTWRLWQGLWLLLSFFIADKYFRANISVSTSFDARKKWPRCASIKHIENQGGCGSCWVRASFTKINWHFIIQAAATVSVLSDRLCISSNAKEQQMITLQDLVSCCEYCGKLVFIFNFSFNIYYW